jgi:HEAT repeat protein
MTSTIEFRPLIAPAIPEIIELLKDSDWRIRIACAYAVSTLSKEGKTVDISGLILLMTVIAEFRHLIKPAIPGIVNLLHDGDCKVRDAVVNTLLELSRQGEMANDRVELCS